MGLKRESSQKPTVLVIFGAAGDLTGRKLLPALYNLYLEGWLPDHFSILGVDREAWDRETFSDHLREQIDSFSRRGKTESEKWNHFNSSLDYLKDDITQAQCYEQISKAIASLEKNWGVPPQLIFYFAIAPRFIGTISDHLNEAGLLSDKIRSRIVVEKPFGRDLASACALGEQLGAKLAESQIFRIDHYLGKETVQNILAFRFANSLFEPLWNVRYVDHVQITVAESLGVGHRGTYYEGAGALRDMIQNHLLQILCCIAMEPPVSFEADEVRNKKVDVLRAIRPIAPDSVDLLAVRGQYGRGIFENKVAIAYRQEEGVADDSTTETFAAVKLFVDNWRWQGVPFYLRTGKRLAARAAEVHLHFKQAPHLMFPESALQNWTSDGLTIRILPDEGISLSFQAKTPEQEFQLSPVQLAFTYADSFKIQPPEAYETLLIDIMRGDATLFMRADQVRAAWNVIMPVLETWNKSRPESIPVYESGSWGPREAQDLIERDGRKWHVLQTKKETSK